MSSQSITIGQNSPDEVVQFLTQNGINNIYIEGDMVCINKGSGATGTVSPSTAGAEAESGASVGPSPMQQRLGRNAAQEAAQEAQRRNQQRQGIVAAGGAAGQEITSGLDGESKAATAVAGGENANSTEGVDENRTGGRVDGDNMPAADDVRNAAAVPLPTANAGGGAESGGGLGVPGGSPTSFTQSTLTPEQREAAARAAAAAAGVSREGSGSGGGASKAQPGFMRSTAASEINAAEGQQQAEDAASRDTRRSTMVGGPTVDSRNPTGGMTNTRSPGTGGTKKRKKRRNKKKTAKKKKK